MRIPHVMTSFGLAASALVGFSVISQSGGTGEAAEAIVELDVRAVAGVPGDATAAVLNITAAQAQEPGFAAAWPCDQPQPETSILNYRPGAAVSNSTVVSLSAQGTVCVSRSSDADLIVDVNSAFRAGGAFTSQNPERLLDTRDSSPAQAGQMMTLTVAGQGSVPVGASSVVINVAAARASDAGYLVAWPCGQAKPATAALNFRPGPAVSNTTVVALARNGRLCLESSASTDIIVDVNGSFSTAGTDPFVPQRLLDTRQTGRTSPGNVVEIDVAGQGGVGADATAAVLNIAAARPSANGYITAWPCGSNEPETSTLNYSNQPISNSTIVGLGNDGKVCMTSSNAVDMVIDVNGGFPDASGIVSFTPSRIIDTRSTRTGGDPVRTGVFVETFDNNSGIDSFDFGVYHRDDFIVSQSAWPGDHDLTCGSPDTQRNVRRDTDDWRYTCRDHLMTAIGDTSGYSTGWFRPRATFSGQRTVSWDVNVTDLGPRQWWEVMIVPAGFSSGVPDCPQCAGPPALSPEPSGLPVHPAGSVVVGNGPAARSIRVHVDGVDQRVEAFPNLCTRDAEGCGSKAIRRPFSMTDNGNGTITVNYGGFATYTVNGSFPSEFVVVFKDHNYTPIKTGPQPGFTWHWDNIVVGG